MTSRERILTALDHREPDRVPIDCGAMRSTGIQAIAYHRLKAYLGVSDGQTRVFDVIQQLAEPEEFYLDRFQIDAINAGREFPCAWKDWILPDGSPCQVPAYIGLDRDGDDWLASGPNGQVVARMAAGTTYFSQTCHPLADEDWMDRLTDLPAEMQKVCWAALAEPIYAGGLSDENLRRMADHLRRLREGCDRAIMLAFGANLFEWASFLRGMDRFLLDLAAEQARAEALLDRLVECHLAGLDRLLPVVAPYIDLIQLGDDLGMETGPFFSHQMMRTIFKPRYQVITGRIRQLAPHVRIFLHSCGSIYAHLPDLIEAGFEVFNPVQISARDMDPVRLKREFGRSACFWGGGCDTQKILCRGTPREVRDHVRRLMDIWAPGGGYVFNQVHNILSEVPPANVLAMYEAVTG